MTLLGTLPQKFSGVFQPPSVTGNLGSGPLLLERPIIKVSFTNQRHYGQDNRGPNHRLTDWTVTGHQFIWCGVHKQAPYTGRAWCTKGPPRAQQFSPWTRAMPLLGSTPCAVSNQLSTACVCRAPDGPAIHRLIHREAHTSAPQPILPAAEAVCSSAVEQLQHPQPHPLPRRLDFSLYGRRAIDRTPSSA